MLKSQRSSRFLINFPEKNSQGPPIKHNYVISKRRHYDKSKIEGQDRIAGQN